MAGFNKQLALEAGANTEDTGLATNDAHLVPLFCERGGIETNYVGLAFPPNEKTGEPGKLYKWQGTGSRSSLSQLRQLALRADKNVVLNSTNEGITSRTGADGKERRNGEVLNYNGRSMDVTNSVVDAYTGERRNRKFQPIVFMLEDDSTGEMKVSPFGVNFVREVKAALSDPDAFDRLLSWLPRAFRGHYTYDPETGNLEGTSIEGIAFVEELTLAVYGSDEAQDEQAEGAPATAGSPDAYDIEG